MGKTVNIYGTSDLIYTSNEKPIDMTSRMYLNYPQLAPLLAIFSKLADDPTSQSTVYWSEAESIPDRVYASSDTAAGADPTVTQFSYLRKWDLLFNPRTFEVMLVDTRPTAAGAVSVQKGWGATTDSAVNAGDVLIKIGNAYPENSEDYQPRMVKNTEFYNYTQEVIKSTQHSTRVMNEATHFGGKGTKRTQANQQMMYDFKKELELGILFGTLADSDIDSTAGVGATKTFSGILEKLRNGSNYYNVNGILSETKIDDWLTQIYTSFPDAKNLIAVLPPRLYSRFNAIAKPLIRLSPNSKRYGMNLNQYDGAVTIDLVRHPLLTGPGLEEMMFVLDTDYMKLRWQKKPEMELDVAMKRYNYVEDKLSCFVTFMAAIEKRHAMAVNIKG